VAPTREYVLPTAAETAALRSGIQFYERREYDKALEVFQRVSTEFPTSMMALYETALTYQARKEYQKAIDAAAKAAEFKNPELARVYALIGNVLDMNGEPKRAVDVYRKGIEFATEAAGTLYYNLAITYAQSLNDLPAAKAAAAVPCEAVPARRSSNTGALCCRPVPHPGAGLVQDSGGLLALVRRHPRQHEARWQGRNDGGNQSGSVEGRGRSDPARSAHHAEPYCRDGGGRQDRDSENGVPG
jgi:tetratricopeptide (TPR) repeat protein